MKDIQQNDLTLNPIQLEVLWNRLLSVANEQQTTLVRTAFSTIVRESLDLACGIFDTKGRMIAQSLTGTPGHINPMATGTINLLNEFPPETLSPGDVLVTNDPWLTAGQINDFTVLTPVFNEDRLVAFFANCCHSPDIGGRILSADAREIFEEGLRIPIMKLFDKGVPNHILFQIIRANVRTPDETIGDLYAQAASNDVGARSLIEMMNEFGLDTIDPLGEEIIRRSEKAMRDAIRKVPNGHYTHELWADGFECPLKIAVAVTVSDQDILIDFEGSSQQSSRGINVVMNYTHGYASFAMKAAISPDVPHNEGAFLPVKVVAPKGSILNCEEPAAVASRHLVGHLLPSAIFGALNQIIPERVLAGGADPGWMSIWRSTWPDTDISSNITVFQLGGTGARPTKDGLNTTGFPSGVGGVPAEVIETLAPILQVKKVLNQDSGGPGKFRGGLGQDMTMGYIGDLEWSVSSLIDRTKYPAKGANGGKEGSVGVFRLNGEDAPPKTVLWFDSDSLVDLNTPGGGGYGDPFERDPELVFDDVVNGYVSAESARTDYGVAIKYIGKPDALVRMPHHYELDWEETANLREV